MDARAEQGQAPVAVETPAEAGLRLDVAGPVATITLDRPDKRNAMTFAMWRALARIGETLPGSVRVVVVRGAGKAFSAGIDLGMFSGGGGPSGEHPQDDDRFIAELQAGYTWLRRPEVVTVAAVHGYAIGAGFQLALACDLRVMTDDAWYCMKEPALGLVPDLTGTKPLVEIVGLNRAMDICLTARKVPAAEAERLGLAERVVPAAELDTAVDELVSALLAVNADAAVATKRLLQQAPGNTLEEQCAAERREQLQRLRSMRQG
ncbi:enoyl-CoA hydratase/carnithine racemase [Actinomadura cellulosilytica]|uniref:Enoyl-CoA hydratase/carnithine racemase n=1 Tax=Thermomonospora cellulosilytica TaxID=1411118 RepID=A0A7W3N256_9ACTN|nr:enoyl-CoA hydratase/isomerase family protein [Thermomonospora cellulosilytica]MBA9006132.1 enoyl-CoA hydratase/carnithine racemase [Thermomonospora cellulosilytica]